MADNTLRDHAGELYILLKALLAPSPRYERLAWDERKRAMRIHMESKLTAEKQARRLIRKIEEASRG